MSARLPGEWRPGKEVLLTRRQVVSSIAAGGAVVAASTADRVHAQEGAPEAGPPTRARVEDAIAQLEPLAQELLERTGVPGMAIGVVHQDDTVYLGGFGVREAGADDAVDPDTIFQIASVSKPVASTVVAGVVGDGQIAWDTKMTDVVPEFALHNAYPTAEVTLRDLFSHRSGLADHAGDLLEDLGFSRGEILHRIRYLEPSGPFRASYAYTNFGLTAAAEAAARAAGATWEDLSDERLYRPAGMDRTSSRFADFMGSENRASGHVPIDGAWVAEHIRDSDAQSPAGGVSSTVRDLSRWMRLQMNGGMLDGVQIIDSASLGQTHLPHVVSNAPADPTIQRAGFYGLGWNVSYSQPASIRLSHSGAFLLGAATTVYLLPDAQLGIVVLTNSSPVGLEQSVALSFLDLVSAGEPQIDYLPAAAAIMEESLAPLYGHALADLPEMGSPAGALEVYTGVYANDYFGELEITANGDDLSLTIGPNDDVFPMRHAHSDIFIYDPVGELATGPSAVTFLVGPGPAASRVVVENLDVHGAGTFVRQ